MLCAGLFAFHCVLFCASAHCNVNCPQMLPILAANLLALYVVSLTEGTPRHYWCHMALAPAAYTCVWFACSPHARQHVNFSLFAKFWHTRGLHLHLGCVASLSNLSGTAHAIGFPQHVDTTAASDKSQNCQHALADVCKEYTAKYKCKNYQRTHTMLASIFTVIRA